MDRSQIKAYLDGELSGQEALQVADALQADPALRADADAFKSISATLRLAHGGAEPFGLEDTLKRLEAPKPTIWQLLAQRRNRTLVLGSLALCALALVAPYVMRSQSTSEATSLVAVQEKRFDGVTAASAAPALSATPASPPMPPPSTQAPAPMAPQAYAKAGMSAPQPRIAGPIIQDSAKAPGAFHRVEVPAMPGASDVPAPTPPPVSDQLADRQRALADTSVGTKSLDSTLKASADAGRLGGGGGMGGGGIGGGGFGAGGGVGGAAMGRVSAATAAPAQQMAKAEAGAASNRAFKLAKKVAPRFIVQTADLSVFVKDVPRSQSFVENRVKGYGGYIANSTDSDLGDRGHQVNLTIRVPVDHFQEVVDAIRGLGEVSNQSVHGDDVSAQIVDTDARLKTLRAEEDQLREILRHTTRVSDMLDVRDRITNLREQIESTDAQNQTLKDQAALSTINLQLSVKPKPEAVVVPAEPPSWFASTWAGAVDNFIGIVKFFVTLVLNLISFSPIILPGLLLALWGWRESQKKLGY